jgi:hypothetical protein
VLKIHLEQYLGIFFGTEDAPGDAPDPLLERAAALLPETDEWSFTIAFSDLFCPGYGDDDPPGALAQDLTEDNNHIHGKLELCVPGRPISRLGFWGPHDVCLNTWLQELLRVLRELDGSPDAAYVFDEMEQGQPAFEFRRSSELLFISVEDSSTSGEQRDPECHGPCDYDDFRLQVHRFRGALRGVLEKELGVERAEQCLRNEGGPT